MKNGTAYAVKMKKAYKKFRQSVDTPEIPEPDDPTDRLAISILGIECGDATARRAVDRILEGMADWNEVRVSKPEEIASLIGTTVPHVDERCTTLKIALQAVFDREDELSLKRLATLGRREAKQFMESLDGVDDFSVASVNLWSLGAHAIPVNDRLLKALHDADLVHPAASRAEVQAFLERHIGAADAKEFCLVMQSFHKAKPATRKKAPVARGAKKTKKSPKKTKAKKAKKAVKRRVKAG